jgi:hypothetical protein
MRKGNMRCNHSVRMTSARNQWFTPVILATHEAEIRRIMFGSQLRQVFCGPYHQKYLTKKGWESGSRDTP